MLKVGEAVQFLHSLGWLHAALSSHAVQLVNPVTVQEVSSVVVQVLPSGDAVTVYPVIAESPS